MVLILLEPRGGPAPPSLGGEDIVSGIGRITRQMGRAAALALLLDGRGSLARRLGDSAAVSIRVSDRASLTRIVSGEAER